MTDTVAHLSQMALQLNLEDRARLAEVLLASVHGKDLATEDVAWDAEIRQRVEEIESADVALIPAEEVFAEVRRNLR